jgi:5-methyltetrahydropteroyltriglutamate--homocysteine methyltransferase
MAPTNRPPFRADHVGSLLRPPKLLDARARRDRGEIDAAELRRAEDEAIFEAVRMQESLGLRAATDGEFRRTWWHTDFLGQIGGCVVKDGTFVASFQREDGQVTMTPHTIAVTGRLARTHPIQGPDFAYLKSVCQVVPKVSIPSPVWVHFRTPREDIDRAAYPDLDAFVADLIRVYCEEVADLAQLGCTYLQLDDTTFPYLCDPKLVEATRKGGRDPAQLLHLYARMLNEVRAAAPPGMAITTHMCRGNFRSAWVASGGWEPVAEILFNEVKIDGFFVEYDDERSGDFAPLRYVPKGGPKVVLGLVTTKRPRLETKDEMKRRIDEAAKYVALDRLCLSPQCGFASTVEGNEIAIDDEKRKLARIVEVATEIWGGV